MVYDGENHRSDVVILDAVNLEKGAIAKLHLKHHIPYGLHGVLQAKCLCNLLWKTRHTTGAKKFLMIGTFIRNSANFCKSSRFEHRFYFGYFIGYKSMLRKLLVV